MSDQKQIVITSAFRTAIGSFGGSLASKNAPELGAEVIKKCMSHSNLKVDDVDMVYMGQVLTTGAGQNPARQAAIHAGILVLREAEKSQLQHVHGQLWKAWFLGMQIQQSDLGIELLQTAYIEAFCRHIAKFYHFVRDQCLSGDIELAGIGTDFQVADVFTKPLAHSKFAAFRNVLCGYRTFESLMNSNAEKTAEIRRLCASEFRLLQSVGLDGHSLERYI